MSTRNYSPNSPTFQQGRSSLSFCLIYCLIMDHWQVWFYWNWLLVVERNQYKETKRWQIGSWSHNWFVPLWLTNSQVCRVKVGGGIHREISNQINVIIVLLFSSIFIFLDQSQHVGFSRMKELLTFFLSWKASR